ncbi:MAG: hypothetical protein E7384_03770 [Ruminococcaceae bacterium]|nr:hypothetical protein [Oscillospiraceae bacterium]
MKNFKKKALLPAIIMVMVSVIALSSATYAWFTVGNDAQLGKLDVQVVAASGIQLSLDAASWKSSIATQDIIDVAVFPAEGYSINPVSTNAKTNSNGRLDFYSAIVNADGTTLTTTAVPAPGEANGKLTPGSADYITFDLYVKVNTAANLYLNADSKVTSEISAGNIATRVAFVHQGFVGTNAAPGDAIKLAKSGEKAVVWEPNATTHTAEAIQLGTAFDGGASANKYKGVKAAATDVPNEPNGSHNTALEAVTTTDDIGVKESGLIAELEPGINKISVSIWLEGQDGDCVNSISGGDISTFLKFTKVDAE